MIGVIILAIVQGIAEFLPISSSAHLIIFREVLNVGSAITKDLELAFDIALHFGTLLAILTYFFKDFLKILIDGIKRKSNLLWYLIIATIPAGLAGVFLSDVIDNVVRGNLYVTSLFLALVGYLLYKIDKISREEKKIEKITFKEAMLIGLAQVLALIPGVSRSGSTITAARFLKLDREAATKFSFFLAAPVIAGATLVTFLKGGTKELIMSNANIFTVGIIVSYITGYFVIDVLLKYIKKNDFKVFMWYRMLLALIIILTLYF